MFELGFENGLVYLNGAFTRANLYCSGGSVAAVSGERLESAAVVDAAGRWVLPGFIDPHVHFALRVGENVSSDDFYAGSVQAALGGVTTFVDFIDPVRGVDGLREAFARRRDEAKQSALDYGLHACVRGLDDPAADFLKESVALGMPTVKLFTTYSSSGRRTRDADVFALLAASRAAGARVVAHAENDDLLREGPGIPVAQHAQARPALCERTAVLNLCELAKAADGLLYIVHTSAGGTACRVREQYPELLHGGVVLESCPQYFWLDDSVYQGADGWRYTCTPPLREAAERETLRAEFDTIDVIGTDHCPFDSALKNRPFTNEIPMGVGGIRYAFSAMFTLFGEKVLPKFTLNPARVEGLFPRKGTLAPGADADVVVFDPQAIFTVDDPASIYHGKTFTGRVNHVFARGRELAACGRFVGQAGAGRFLSRRLGEA